MYCACLEHSQECTSSLKNRLSLIEKQLRQMGSDHQRQQCQTMQDISRKKHEDLENQRLEYERAIAKAKEDGELERQKLLRDQEQLRMELQEKCCQLGEENRALRERLNCSNDDIKSLRDESQRLSEEVAELRPQLEECKREIIEMEKLRNDLLTRLESSEEDAEGKETEIEQLKDRYQSLLDQKRKLEYSLNDWTRRSQKFEDLYKVQYEETEKAVQIMHKCVNYSHTCKDKCAKVESAARKLQDVLRNKEADVAKLSAENERLTMELDDLKEKVRVCGIY